MAIGVGDGVTVAVTVGVGERLGRRVTVGVSGGRVAVTTNGSGVTGVTVNGAGALEQATRAQKNRTEKSHLHFTLFVSGPVDLTPAFEYC
jgi:hypothetical protein